MEMVLIVIVGLFVLYKVGAFGAAVDLFNVATRESAAYNREHKSKVAKRYLGSDFAFTEEEVTKINSSIKAIDDLKFD